uniref:Ixodegrin B n=1 Tax=Rhipicephalus zambeziensis TaxID=60191 RepID=A0A224YB15_9ACAR
MPRPGEPGSPENPGTIQPGPTQHWLASVFHRGFIPRERLRHMDQLCTERTICEEGTCCLETPGKSRLCKPTAKRGEPCTRRSLTNVYLGNCFCGYNQGTCEEGFCT